MAHILELRDLHKQYAGSPVVDGVSLAIERGELFSLLGPSGCGKTTTLRMVAGFEEPGSGEIVLNGRRINELRPYERNVSTVFQNYALFPHLSVAENIAFGLRRRGADRIKGRVQDAVRLVHLEGKESRLPAQLSGGERQRVALARSLVLEPEILLLDEPLSALDPILRKQVRGELHALQRRVGITFLLVTHDQEEALSLSDRIAVMQSGRIDQIGTPREIYLQPATRFVADFMGSMNWIDGCGVRPEALHLGPVPPDAVRARTATVSALRFLGNCVHIESRLEHSGEAVVCEAPRSLAGVQPGDRVHLWWQLSDEVRPPR